MGVCVIGTGHTKFGRLEKNLYELIVEAGKEALNDSGIESKEIGAIFIANYDAGGFNNQGHLGPIALEIHPDLRFKPTTKLESACASGSAAILAAMNAIEAGKIKFALVIGVEKMTSLSTSGVAKVLATGSHWPSEGSKGMTFPGLFAEYAKGYKSHYNFSDDELRIMLAKVSAKNHKNALENPFAQLPLDITYEAGKIKFALVIGVEKMTSLSTSGVAKVLATGSHWPSEGSKGMTFPGLFAEYAKGYKSHYNFSDDELRIMLAKVSAKNHKNALENPFAQLPLDITYEDILNIPDEKNPVIAYPLRLYDCSLISDGAAALILADEDRAKSIRENLVEIVAMESATDYLPLSKRSNYEFTAGKIAVGKAYEKAGISVDDLNFAEVHDCFTIAEILAYETLGITKDGEGYKALDEGIVYKDGKLPVNLSGGLKAKGHPVGATGVSMGVIAVRQLLGSALGHQLESPEIGITFNIGGSAASNYVGIYKRIR